MHKNGQYRNDRQAARRASERVSRVVIPIAVLAGISGILLLRSLNVVLGDRSVALMVIGMLVVTLLPAFSALLSPMQMRRGNAGFE